MTSFSFSSSAGFGVSSVGTASVSSSASADGCFSSARFTPFPSSVCFRVSFSLVGTIDPFVLSSSVDLLSVRLLSVEHLPPA